MSVGASVTHVYVCVIARVWVRVCRCACGGGGACVDSRVFVCVCVCACIGACVCVYG